MKIKRSKKTKSPINKVLIGGIIVLLLAVGAYTAAARINNFWPFTAKESTQSEDPNTNNEDPSTPNKTPDDPSDPDYIKPDISNPPSDTTPYPIETERYRIDKLSEKSFSVELYPIINNPRYSNYNEQLRDYKNEVLNYLKKRYGDTSSLKIDWIPEDAKNI